MVFSCAILNIHHQSFILILLVALPCAGSLSFNFSSFPNNNRDILTFGDAFSSGSVLHLTKNEVNTSLNHSVGRAIYAQPVRLWDADTQTVTDFITHFSFQMIALYPDFFGDGLAFFLAPVDSGSIIPNNSAGGYLGLVDSTTMSNSSENQIVAVEFDSFKNKWDPDSDHVGINVNSYVSVASVSWGGSIKNGGTTDAWVVYNSHTQNLKVFATYMNKSVDFSYIIDLRTVLPETVNIGFSAATGDYFETHTILSWDFNSTLEVTTEENSDYTPTEPVPISSPNSDFSESNSNAPLVVGLVVPAVCISVGLLCLFLVIWWRKRRLELNADEELDNSMDDEFEKGTGPKRFTYADLSCATRNFSDDRKLGEGGFGGVYKGLLSDSDTEIAVKRISKGSKQGKKEYISEVKIISKLRHRNLVQLIGWCHGQGELLLVYELMPNGSLDSHLFGNKEVLTWEIRHKIALGLASAMLYLHEEGEQCVIHRDIKSSNIMLDSNFNAKLGDFGLARFVDHNLESQTTVLAGTMGYMAPECYMTGKASKESDVYSFGIVALEITCGRKPIELRAELTQVRLLEWVWRLYGEGQLTLAADQRLSSTYNEKQLQDLMKVGLWCCHPDSIMRPSIRQVINVLNSESPLPTLPSKLPVPTYAAPVINSYSDILHSGSDQYASSTFTEATSTSSSKALLLSA